LLPVINDTYLVLLVIVSGLGSRIYRSPAMVIAIFFATILLLLINKVKVNRKLLYVIAIWIALNGMFALMFGTVRWLFTGRYMTVVLIAYAFTKVYKNSLFDKYVMIISTLALISLVFWLWQVFSPSSLYQLMSRVDIGFDYLERRTQYHMIVYTARFVSRSSQVRNFGFCWEPGPFSIYLTIALFFNIYKRGNNVVNYLLIIAIITTYSTTGYAMLYILLFYRVVKKRSMTSVFMALVILAVFFVSYMQLDFMKEKIEAQAEVIDDFNTTGELLGATYMHRTGRFSGLLGGVINLYKYPFGVGGNYELKIDSAGTLVNGIGGLLGTFGVFSVAFFLIYIKTSKYFAALFGVNKRYVFFNLTLVALFGFSIQTNSILGALLLMGLFFERDESSLRTYVNEEVPILTTK